MIEAGRDADLAEESLVGDRAREIGIEHLDRDVAVVLQIAREEHGRHAAMPELALDRVPPAERRLQVGRGERGGHRPGLPPRDATDLPRAWCDVMTALPRFRIGQYATSPGGEIAAGGPPPGVTVG